MLVDSGATCNFVDRAFVKRHGLTAWELPKRLRVRMADGKPINCSQVLPSVRIALPGYVGEHDLVVIPHIDGFDVVLGRAFLKLSKACVNHATSTVTWPDRESNDTEQEALNNSIPDACIQIEPTTDIDLEAHLTTEDPPCGP